MTEGGLAASWGGGPKGRMVIDRFLDSPAIERMLSRPDGAFYLILVEENEPREVIEKLNQKGMIVGAIKTRRAGREKLHAIKFIWASA